MDELPPHWTREDLLMLDKADSFKELGEVALRVLKRIPQPVGQVCGPISTGGLGNREANTKRLKNATDRLISEKKNIFSQLPLQNAMVRLINKNEDNHNPYDLLEGVYLLLFETGLMKTLYFLPGWETSLGTKWEHQMGEMLKMELVHLSEEFVK